MANQKKRTTMAKLNREQRLRERRQEKDALKEARKQAPSVDEEPVAVHREVQVDEDELSAALNRR